MGIDRILDMLRTAVNITGDAVCTTIVSHQEKALNREYSIAINCNKTACEKPFSDTL